jgi:hypothetical protein
VAGSCEHSNEASGSKRRDISWPAERLLASQEGLLQGIWLVTHGETVVARLRSVTRWVRAK